LSVKKLAKQAEKIMALADTYSAMSDEELKAQTDKFKERYANGEKLEKIMPEAFAVVREASTRTLGMTPYKEQIMAAIVLQGGNLAEQKTGEGKTLTVTMPVYLNALAGEGVHVITVNEYLAQRDAEWNGKLYEFLGMTVGVSLREQSPEQKRAAYGCDITYVTHAELGFDYLRDNMVLDAKDRVLRGLHVAFIDEADSVLIDEARTPLIISGGKKETARIYTDVNLFVKKLEDPVYEWDKLERKRVAVSGDYEVDEKNSASQSDCKRSEKSRGILPYS
jgi:preprotein translocase subunit SecA